NLARLLLGFWGAVWLTLLVSDYRRNRRNPIFLGELRGFVRWLRGFAGRRRSRVGLVRGSFVGFVSFVGRFLKNKNAGGTAALGAGGSALPTPPASGYQGFQRALGVGAGRVLAAVGALQFLRGDRPAPEPYPFDQAAGFSLSRGFGQRRVNAASFVSE